MMDKTVYRLERIEGEYARLLRESDGEELFIAMALLPDGVDEGDRLEYEFPNFTVI